MYTRILAFAIGFAYVTSALAEGPGSRLRTTPEIPPPATSTPAPGASEEQKRCDALSREQKENCLVQLRSGAPGRGSSGPEATGMGSGAGSSAASGTTGGVTFGGSAPR
jgi:hypothetical protein